MLVRVPAWKRSKFALLFCFCNFNEQALDVPPGHLLLCFSAFIYFVDLSFLPECVKGFSFSSRLQAAACAGPGLVRLPSPGSPVLEREEGTCPSGAGFRQRGRHKADSHTGFHQLQRMPEFPRDGLIFLCELWKNSVLSNVSKIT